MREQDVGLFGWCLGHRSLRSGRVALLGQRIQIPFLNISIQFAEIKLLQNPPHATGKAWFEQGRTV